MCQHEEGWNKKITRRVLEPLLCSGPLLLLWSVLLFLINYSFTNVEKKKISRYRPTLKRVDNLSAKYTCES